MARNSDPLSIEAPRAYLGHGQFRHALLLAALLPGAWAMADPSLDDGDWLGLSDRSWWMLAMATPVLQQVLVVLFWRAQLCHRLVTRIFGDAGFVAWGVIFMPLLIARPLLTIAVGVADQGSLSISPLVGVVVGSVLLVPTVWTMRSVVKVFGIPRALGGDHFLERYRTMPMVREGALKYSSNAMYMFAFVGLWGIALICRSQAALAVALFHHAYIWVHWYCTEQPDGVVLYGRSQDED